MIRTILSPGVELHEVDKSQYTPDVASNPRALVMGFASKGPAKMTTDITSMADFRTIYGTPTNEVERYFYNAADQLLGAGATVVASKIPYTGEDSYIGTTYTVTSKKRMQDRANDFKDIFDEIEALRDGDPSTVLTETLNQPPDSSEISDVISNVINDLSKTDSTITDLRSIYAKTVDVLTIDDYLKLNSGERPKDSVPPSSFTIVDKTRGAYRTFTGNGSKVECLGILPVVTTAVNAMAIAEGISTVKMNSVREEEISVINRYEPVNEIAYIDSYSYTGAGGGVDLSASSIDISSDNISAYWSVGPNSIKGAYTLDSISKTAAKYFPSVKYISNNGVKPSDGGMMPFDHTYFSYIGVVVFKVNVDRGSGSIFAEPVEAFAGSLLADAKDLRTNGSVFIEDIINTTSNYISIYVDIAMSENRDDNETLEEKFFNENTILYAAPGKNVILGIPSKQLDKKLSFERIMNNMDNIFKSQSNILGSTLDVVVDAGLSTIGQCVYGTTEGGQSAAAPKDVSELPLIRNDNGVQSGPWPGWRAIVNKMKQFCEETRKDCVFVCDSPRFLSLKNQRKIVNAYDPNSSVSDNILPKIKLISGIGTSYGWGYAAWFKIADSASGTTFWCPPSIFGASKYISTRTRWHTWYAPAGISYGAINVDDTSFEPDLNARNVIYSNGWNYSLTDIQNGVTSLEGQKTFQSYTSAFDRINVRSLFLDLERRVFKIARNYIYEPNTADTRQQFIDNITPIFESTKAAGGCYDYKIIADESINTPEVIDNNEFRVRIGIQPAKTIEFILLEFVACRTGSDWSELAHD